MLLLDSSVWIQVLRRELRWADLPGKPDEWAVTEPVVMEVLAGSLRLERVHTRMNALTMRSVDPVRDYFDAALLYRAARAAGSTIRSLNDCLIAAIALRHQDVVVHRDGDFEALAQISDLQTIDLR